MALEPVQNRYVAHLRAIRAIQEYLVRRAERHAIPAVDNTNVDRSVAAIHATAFGCLRRLARVRPAGLRSQAVLPCRTGVRGSCACARRTHVMARGISQALPVLQSCVSRWTASTAAGGGRLRRARRGQGEALLEAGSKATRAVAAEYAAATTATWSSKAALEAIRAKVAAGGRLSDSDQPSTSTASPLGALLGGHACCGWAPSCALALSASCCGRSYCGAHPAACHALV